MFQRKSNICVDLFKLLKEDELQEKRKDRGEGYIQNEKFRILWDGIPIISGTI